MKTIQILIATHNNKKIEEFKHLMHGSIESLKKANLLVQIVGADDVDIDMDSFLEKEETLIGNALAKAEYAFKKTGLLSIADDSGLFIDVLPDILGVYSARFEPKMSYPEKVQEILKRLSEFHVSDRDANMSTAIAVVGRNFKTVIERKTDGIIAQESRGTEGFEYDKIFIPQGDNQTFSEMGLLEKNNYSARKAALEDVLYYIHRRLVRDI